MDVVKERVVEHLKLAQIIAAKYFNIQGASQEEVLSEARMALVKASMAYQEDKGPFAPFAGTVIRNALNSFFNKQLRNAKMVSKSLDETINGATQFGTYIGNLGQNMADTKRDVFREVGERERSKELLRALKTLNNKEKEIIDSISRGMSLSEVAKQRNVSKQAIFKIVKKTYQELKKEIKYAKD